MKKLIYRLFVVVLLFSMAACGIPAQNHGNETSTASSTEAVTTTATEAQTESQTSGLVDWDSVTCNTDYELDRMMVEELEVCQSNVDISETFGKYADEWEKLIDKYYSIILEYNSLERFSDDLAEIVNTDLATIVKEDQEKWEANLEEKLEFIRIYNRCLYGPGTGAGPNSARMFCELYRERALTLYSYCTDFRIECTAP